MENKIAIVGIMLENRESVKELNKILTDYGDYIIGRLGIPYREKAVNVISITIDAPERNIEELNDKIKKLDNISAKTVILN